MLLTHDYLQARTLSLRLGSKRRDVVLDGSEHARRTLHEHNYEEEWPSVQRTQTSTGCSGGH